jgi:hypothetical protein
MTLTRAIDQIRQGEIRHRDIDFGSLHDYPPFQELMRPRV